MAYLFFCKIKFKSLFSQSPKPGMADPSLWKANGVFTKKLFLDLLVFTFRGVENTVTDLNGKIIKQINIKPVSGINNLDASLLNAGTYIYTLIADGNKIESKRMIVAK